MSSNVDPSLDRRVQRTRGALRDALIALIGERGWDEVAVQDICERANVGRSTFYLHYSGKEALLEGGLDNLRRHLQAAPSQRAAHAAAPRWPGFTFAEGLASHVGENHTIFRKLIGRRGGFAVHQRFHDMMVKLIETELPKSSSRLPREVQSRCVAALFTELLGWWADTQCQVPAAHVAKLLDEATAALLLSGDR